MEKKNIAVVTGASGGLGREFVRLLAKDPEIDEVWAIARNEEKLYHLKKKIGKKVKTYSQGMLQRLRIAQAIMEQPKYLLMDEPMNALDEEGHHVMKQVFRTGKQNGTTILFTAHNREDVYAFADYVLRIKGKKVEKTKIEELAEMDNVTK